METFTPMLSLLFRSRARLERELAVERTRREFLEQDNRELRERVTRAESQLTRYVEQALASKGVIHSPLRDRDPNAPPQASPFARVMSALSRDTLSDPTSEAPMPES